MKDRVHENQEEYTSVLSALGLSDEEIAAALKHLSGIFDLSIIAGDSRMDLIDARQEYDQEMRHLLGNESYRRYRDYEQSKNSKRELESFKNYVVDQKLEIDGSVADIIERAIRETESFSTETCGGPYDPLPHPNTGISGGYEVKAQLAQLGDNYANLIPKLNDVLSPSTLNVVIGYYGERLAGLQRVVTISLADEQTRTQMLEKIRAGIAEGAEAEAEAVRQAAVNGAKTVPGNKP